MDWKQILSLSPEELTSENVDELYSSVAWYDFDNEELDLKKCLAVIKLSQEIMKFKDGQVQMLLAELDELAVKRGEDEAKKSEYDTDGRSSKSRKSTISLEYDDLEQKYVKLKTRYKQQSNLNDKHKRTIEELNKSVEVLSKEKEQLQYELQNAHQDGSQSDISETVREKHKELINSLHYKNKQISNLLGDIEEVEKENLLLREKLTSVRDELSEATNQITTIYDEITAEKEKNKQYRETIEGLTRDCDNLKDEIASYGDQKESYEKQIAELKEDMNLKIDHLRKTIDQKDQEIATLKKQLPPTSAKSSTKSSGILEKTQAPDLNATIKEQTDQIMDFQMQLHSATIEMEKTTAIVKKLTLERDSSLMKIQELTSMYEDSKKQLKIAHERCRDMQEQVNFVEGKYQEKDRDLREMIVSLKEGGMMELSDALTKLEDVKAQNNVQEKRIRELVRAANKLQTTCDALETENDALREKLGITGSESVCVNGVLLKQRKQKKQLLKMHKQLEEAYEHNLSLKTNLQKKNRVVANLSEQVVSLGGKPKVTETPLEISSKSEDMKGICEENDALRKGLHEILDSINKKRESTTREINSTILEKLLRALDVRHVSGWYHPAMRLQAELHTLQGTNAELREQLRLNRIELMNVKGISVPESAVEADSDASSNETYVVKERKGSEKAKASEEGEIIENVSDEHAEDLKRKLVSLQEVFEIKETSFEDNIKQLENTKRELEDKLAASEAKLEEFLTQNAFGDDEMIKIQHAAELAQKNVVSHRKCVYLENKDAELTHKIKQLQQNLLDEGTLTIRKLSAASKTEKQLRNELENMKNAHTNCITTELFVETQKSLDKITLKYKDLLHKFTEISNENSNELTVLKQTVDTLKTEKTELETKLVDAITKIHSSGTSDEVSSKKLAQCEVALFTEKQRANHMSNLYELVKEQLQKSEERFCEIEKYNKEIAHKNLVLQENLKELQDQECDYVDQQCFKELQDKCAELLDAKGKLVEETDDLKEEVKVFRNARKLDDLWTDAREYEFMSLKHQLVDLQATTDDRTVIARLSSDVVRARLSEAECDRKVHVLNEELDEMRAKYEKCESLLKQEQDKLNGVVMRFENKIISLKSLLKRQRLQYLGCMPMLLQETYVEKLKAALLDKKGAFKALREAQAHEKECAVLKEEMQLQSKHPQELLDLIRSDGGFKALSDWHKEKCVMQLTELKLRRQLEFKEDQLQQTLLRVNNQEEELIRLEEELIQAYQRDEDSAPPPPPPTQLPELIIKEPEAIPIIKLFSSQETQTLEMPQESSEQDATLRNVQMELLSAKNEASAKEAVIEQLKNRIKEVEMDVNLFKKQIGDKQSQITFYEKHILELQSKKEERISVESTEGGGDGFSVPVVETEDVVALKDQLGSMQRMIKEKEECIVKFQSLLKQDRDEHSLAAARMQEEHKKLQIAIIEQQRVYAELKDSSKTHPGKAAIEQYVQQVHQMEQHMAELHTTVTSQNSQLQASREEAVRWRGLANDRLQSMENLRKELDEQHQREIASYRYEAHKWRNEVSNLNTLLVKLKNEMEEAGPDYGRLLKEKDDRIHELAVTLRQVKGEAKRMERDKTDAMISPKVNELEMVKEQLTKEHETLKKRYEQLLNRERNAREEIRNLKGQLMRRPALSARSDRSDRSTKEKLQTKVTSLENEVHELKQALEHQVQLNESHRVTISEDFDKWNKQKHFQQTAERLKTKLKERDDEFEKLQQTCAGYRILIERLEREKHGWESKVKSLKGHNPLVHGAQAENAKLRSTIDELHSKLEMQQHHSGALGAAMLQEKLAAQERKIALLELAAKGTVEIRAEVERLHATNASLQKRNLCLEAENLELRLDLEKSVNEVPYLREQIQHLENYVEVLKAENVNTSTASEQDVPENRTADSKKVAELEKTIFVLKRVVEKFKTENKRLTNNRPCALPDRSVPADKLRGDLGRLRQKYGESVQKTARLEQELAAANARIKASEGKAAKAVQKDSSACFEELERVKGELEQKMILLDRVKVLLQRAAVKERAMLEEIANLRAQVPGSSSRLMTD